MIVYNNNFFKIVEKDGHFICQQPSAVAIVAETDNGFLFVKQYRPAVGHMTLELPAGRIDKGEEPIDAAIRELREETGYTAGSMVELVSFYPSPGIHDERIYIFRAHNLVAGEQDLDPGEDVEVLKVPASKLLEQNFTDGKTLIGLTIAGVLSFD